MTARADLHYHDRDRAAARLTRDPALPTVPSFQHRDAPSLPMVACGWMLVSAMLSAVMSALIRHVSAELHPFEIAFFRSAFAVLWTRPWLWQYGRSALLPGRRLPYIGRSLFSLWGMLGGFYATAHIPLADATAISFTGPLFVTVGAALVLGERVRVRRWTATLIGFVGVLVLTRPGADSINPVALIALSGAAAGAGSTLFVKVMSRTEPPNAIVTMMVVYLAPMTLPPALAVWQTPSWTALGWMMLLAGVGTLVHVALTRAMRAADASLVLTFDYMRLPFAALVGFSLFAEAPTLWTFLGGGIIAASSTFIAHREAVLARRAAAERAEQRAA